MCCKILPQTLIDSVQCPAVKRVPASFSSPKHRRRPLIYSQTGTHPKFKNSTGRWLKTVHCTTPTKSSHPITGEQTILRQLCRPDSCCIRIGGIDRIGNAKRPKESCRLRSNCQLWYPKAALRLPTVLTREEAIRLIDSQPATCFIAPLLELKLGGHCPEAVTDRAICFSR
jgi:hypothetical protein